VNHARLISNGRHFKEVYWHPQPQPVQAELAPYSPASPTCQPNAGLEPAIHVQGSRRASPTPISSPKPFPHSSRASSHRPLTPRMDQRVRRSPSVTSTGPGPARAATPSLPGERARQVIKTWIETSLWLRTDEKEPVVGAPGVPTCALQLADKGQSIYYCFLVPEKDRKGKILGYKCASDPASTRDRLHRAIGRERVKYGHRPFKCPRHHDPNCDFQGYSQENLGDHLANRNNPAKCHLCGKSLAAKNMQRHHQDMHNQR